MLRVEINDSGADTLLARLVIEMRGKALKAAVKSSVSPVRERAMALCPKGPRRSGKHLRDTIVAVVRDYGEVQVGLVGPSYPAGAHGHLVEFGHAVVRNGKTVGRAAPRPFLRPAVEQTAAEQSAAFVQELERHIEAA